MAKKNRDDFPEKTKLHIAKRAGWLCSDPSCRRHTVGSNSEGDGEISLGVAAHICAAAPGGPRYDLKMTRDQRKSPDNGIWMCQLHGRAVDANDSTFTVELLRDWKATAQKESRRRVLYNDVPPGPVVRPAEGTLPRDLQRCRLKSEKTCSTKSRQEAEWTALISLPPSRKLILTLK